jgi:hypothetical protein
LRKTAFTGMYLRIAAVFLFLLCAVLFRLTALWKGWKSSGLNDRLDGGFGSTHALLEGFGLGQWRPEVPGTAESIGETCTLFQFIAFLVSGVAVCVTMDDRNS